MKKRFAAFAFLALVATTLIAQPQPPGSAAHMLLQLQKLQTVGSVLYVAAHPDDENTALLSYLVNERHLRTGYLSLTRGDGGQNLIGSQKGDVLGVIRTDELLAARRIDGAEQFFTRAIDFGYSKSPEETLKIWGKEEVLHDVVWVIRNFRPDVIITRFPANGDGGHGQHTASALLAAEAFKAAADPQRFPEQLRYVKTWQPKRLFWNAWRPQLENRTAEMPRLYTIDLGSYNRILGKSYTELAGESRSMHKSQGFGSAERRGSLPNYYELLAGDAPASDILEGIDLSWSRIPGGANVQKILSEASAAFDQQNPQKIVPILIRARAAMRALVDRDPVVAVKLRETDDLIRDAAGLWLEAIAEKPRAVPGTKANITLTAVNRSEIPMKLVRASVDGASQSPGVVLDNNKPLPLKFEVDLAPGTPVTHPYWLVVPPQQGLHVVTDATQIGRPDVRGPIAGRFTIEAAGETLEFEEAVFYRWTDRVQGERYRPFAVVPPVTAELSEKTYYFASAAPREITVSLTGHTATAVEKTIALDLPAGWKSSPQSARVNVAPGSRTTTRFTITPPKDDSTGVVRVKADGEQIPSLVSIDFDHIPQRMLFPPSEARIVRTDIARRGSKIGYVMGPGDEIPEALRQIGYDVTLLTDDELANGDLSRFDAIVIGVRAYNMREALKQHNARIHEYVSSGGTAIVQYNTADETLLPGFAPYTLKLGRDRVTVEEASVTVADPKHPLFTTPNVIRSSDFEGWVQERGLYFASEWAPEFEPLLVSNDPGEPERKGGHLVARHGKGLFIYTGYAWFRQLPAGVPGAMRLFANMVSAKGTP